MLKKTLTLAGIFFAALALAAGYASMLGVGAGVQAASHSAALRAPELRPKVTPIKADGLKTLLNAGSARERPLLVNFWATWCKPCRAEFPDLVKIREQYTLAKLDFVVVSLDDPADLDKGVPDFLSGVRATAMPAYLLHANDEDTAVKLVDASWSGELPATYLYDRQGKVVFKHAGPIKPDELRAAIDQTLGAEPSDATGAINSAPSAANSAPNTAARPPVHEINAADFQQLLRASAASGRPLLVNFWATWCHGCRQEMPDLIKINAQNEARGLDFITVSIDKISEIDKGVPEFLGQVGGARVRAYLLDDSDLDAAMHIADPSWQGQMPATFLYDRQGRLAYTHKGVITPSEVQAALEKVLAVK